MPPSALRQRGAHVREEQQGGRPNAPTVSRYVRLQRSALQLGARATGERLRKLLHGVSRVGQQDEACGLHRPDTERFGAVQLYILAP